MIAKEQALIISTIKKFPLQIPLLIEQLKTALQKGFSMHFSLQPQPILQTLCKEKTINYQLFTKLPFAKPFAENLNLPI